MNKTAAAAKAKELVSKMTAEEKISQLIYNAPAIERLGINEYNWWNEALHGVARAGTATVFPQAISLAATFNPKLIEKCADVISVEGRAKYNYYAEYGDRDIFKGLTYWSPNINISRDPRWGRNHETYGEDPYLTSAIGCAFVKGLQGDGDYYKACACAKHCAAHSGPENIRVGFNATVSKKDMEETYLPAFRSLIKSGVAGVMGSYNAINGVPANANRELIEDTIRDKFGFDGYFVSDCGAIAHIYKHHHFASSMAEAAAVSLKAGCDLNCGSAYEALYDAYDMDLVTDEDITQAAERLFTIRYLLGEFEEERPYSDIPYTKVDCKEHKQLNVETAMECFVLLKNENSFLPLDNSKEMNIGIVGPNSLSVTCLEGNYEGRASEYITIADGIRRVFTNSEIRVAEGCKHLDYSMNDWDGNNNMISDGVAVASVSDITILCLGLDSRCEGEGNNGDKDGIMLPEIQLRLAEEVCAVCDNVIVLVMAGSSVDIGEKVRAHAKSIIYGWYPGAQGGLAMAKVLAGEKSPCGRMPITIYDGSLPLPDFTDYSMKGRTYRFLKEKPVYPFGFGLSYTSVKYENPELISIDDNEIKVSATVTNTGSFDVNEKLQVYAAFTDSRADVPAYQLCGIDSKQISAGETIIAEFTVDRYWIKAVDEDGTRREPDGNITLYIGSSQPDELSRALGAPKSLEIKIK